MKENKRTLNDIINEFSKEKPADNNLKFLENNFTIINRICKK